MVVSSAILASNVRGTEAIDTLAYEIPVGTSDTDADASTSPTP